MTLNLRHNKNTISESPGIKNVKTTTKKCRKENDTGDSEMVPV